MTGPMPLPEGLRRRTYRVREVALETGLSPSMVRKLVKLGRLDAAEIDGVVLITAESYERYLSEFADRVAERRAQRVAS